MRERRYGSLGPYLVGSLLARAADEGVAVTVALLAISRTGSAALGAEVLACWMAPHVLVAPAVGAVVARVRRPILCYAAGLAVFAMAIVGVGVSVGRAPVGLVVAVAVVGGSCGPLVSGGLSSLVAALVPAERQSRAYALDATGYTAAGLFGPALATGVARFGSPGLAAVVLGASAAVAVLPILLLPARREPGTSARPGVRDLAHGLAL
ncbi:MAG: MFS transporter, partial [Actinoallomurus sp.]